VYQVAVCGFFKNESQWLPEWIEYHRRAIGADHFYLYNNDSTDEFEKVLAPYVASQVVEVIDWSSSDTAHRVSDPFDAPWIPYQVGAYHDCLKRARGVAKWVAMIDIDEFIVPIKPRFFRQMLCKAERERRGAITIDWRIFGTSGVWDLADGEQLGEKLLWRAEDGFKWHTISKSIYQPKAVLSCHVHGVTELVKGFKRGRVASHQVRIHHYWTRTGRFCQEKRGMNEEKDGEFLEALHRLEDRAILQYY
jgi:hypothetical protein